MRRVYRLTRAAGARLSAALFSFLPVMNEKHAAAGAMDSLHPKLLHSHRIHFSENNEASLVLPAAAFWKTARNLNLSSVRYFYYLWCRNGTFTGRDVLTNRTQPGFALVPLFCTFGVVTALLPIETFWRTARNLVLHSFPLFCTFVNYDSIH